MHHTTDTALLAALLLALATRSVAAQSVVFTPPIDLPTQDIASLKVRLATPNATGDVVGRAGGHDPKQPVLWGFAVGATLGFVIGAADGDLLGGYSWNLVQVRPSR